jgi:hypothetical protein
LKNKHFLILNKRLCLCEHEIWLSIPFIGRTRIGFSLSDREIARAFRRRTLAAEEQDQRAAEEAEIYARAKAFAERWAPIVSNLILVAAVLVVIGAGYWFLL